MLFNFINLCTAFHSIFLAYRVVILQLCLAN